MMSINGAKELQNSSLWREVESEIDYRVHSLMQTLLTCPVERLESVRIQITCLNELKQMPTTVIDREK
jgi:hypothetical protein